MSITIADPPLLAALARAAGPVEVRSPDGRLIGTFTPRPPEPTISEEELRRREEDRSARHYTAAEVEARLRELRCSQ